jgi:hypothetical protein
MGGGPGMRHSAIPAVGQGRVRRDVPMTTRHSEVGKTNFRSTPHSRARSCNLPSRCWSSASVPRPLGRPAASRSFHRDVSAIRSNAPGAAGGLVPTPGADSCGMVSSHPPPNARYSDTMSLTICTSAWTSARRSDSTAGVPTIAAEANGISDNPNAIRACQTRSKDYVRERLQPWE